MSLSTRGRTALTLLTAAAAVVAIAGPAAAAAGTQDSSAESASHPAKPTIVLVHGAWADASSFATVTERLQKDDYTVVSAPQPLRGLASDAASVAAFVNQATTGPVVLVGHSYGGSVITNAALQAPTVKALAYIDAFAPDLGESVVDLAGAKPGSVLAAAPESVFNVVQDPNMPTGDPDLYVQKAVFAAGFTADLNKSEAAVLAASQRPVAGGALQEPSAAPAWKSIPSFFLIGTKDKVIPVAEQEAMAARAGGVSVKVAAGHLSMLEKPKDVARLIERAADSVK
ncbi:alpha/beta hydrolase [Conyzicola nivalis]|uniref:Alpha/beta hydrolase n=1 Tax=Conyzicola nivalis TaxID=1477021 RepID=A0A916WEK8_9MICO|nr:alpha/beta hydrolase [Conyzicola nivalis]GGA90750.1 alpha/beta hydrolase [Conyzicola nivalis]